MKQLVWVVLIGCLGIHPLKAQLPAHYNQYMFNQLILNPAYAGSGDVLHTTLLYRKQWLGFPGAPQTGIFSIHAPFRDDENNKNNAGLMVVHDRLGVASGSLVLGSYAFRFPFAKGKLALGLQAGAEFLRNRLSLLYTPQPGDPEFAADSPLFVLPKLGFGTWYQHSRFYLGFSVPELLTLKNAAYKAFNPEEVSSTFFLLSGGYLFQVSKGLKIKPSFLLKYMPPFRPQADFNLNFILNDLLWLGLSYRTENEIIGLFEVRAGPQLRIGYSLGLSLHELAKYSYGSHELMLSYEFGVKIKTGGPRYF